MFSDSVQTTREHCGVVYMNENNNHIADFLGGELRRRFDEFHDTHSMQCWDCIRAINKIAKDYNLTWNQTTHEFEEEAELKVIAPRKRVVKVIRGFGILKVTSPSDVQRVLGMLTTMDMGVNPHKVQVMKHAMGLYSKYPEAFETV